MCTLYDTFWFPGIANFGKLNNSSLDSAGIPCLAGYSVFLQGNCVSCAIPLLMTDLQNYDLHDDDGGGRIDYLRSKEVLRPAQGLSL